jgi:hypothetical protein
MLPEGLHQLLLPVAREDATDTDIANDRFEMGYRQLSVKLGMSTGQRRRKHVSTSMEKEMR